jgi:hypothetical protein
MNNAKTLAMKIILIFTLVFSVSTFANVNFSLDSAADTMELNDGMESSNSDQNFSLEKGDLTKKQFSKRVRRFCKRVKKSCKKAKKVSKKECRSLKKECLNANGVKSRFASIKNAIKNTVKKAMPKLSSLFKKGKDDKGQFVEATIKNKLLAKLAAFNTKLGKISFAQKEAGSDAIVIRTYINDKATLKEQTLPGERPFPKWLKLDGARERFSNVKGWTIKKQHKLFFDAKRKVLGFFIKNDKTDMIFQQIDSIKRKIAGPIVSAIIPTPDYIPFPIKVKKKKIGRVSIMSNHKNKAGTSGIMIMIDYKMMHAML